MERKCNKTAQARVPVLPKHPANRLFPQTVRPALPKRLSQKFPRKLSDISIKFSRRAPGLFQHGGIEQQSNARDEGSLLFRRLSLLTSVRRQLLPRAVIRVQREIAPKL